MSARISGIWRSLALCAAYIVLNASLNLLNRWALGIAGFTFPLTLTAAHMLFNPLLLLPMMLIRGLSWTTSSSRVMSSWRAIVFVGLSNGVQIALNNSSLVHMELALNQVVRAAMPVIVALMAAVIERKTPTGAQLACLGVISTGVALAVYKDNAGTSGDLAGSLLVLSSVAVMALQMTFSGKLGLQMDAVEMTFYTGWISFVPVAIAIVRFEGSAMLQHVVAHPATSMAIVLSSCMLAVLYNVVVFETIRSLSSVGSAVLGNVKVVVILVASAAWIGEMRNWQWRQHIGCILTFTGAAAYSAVKLRKARKS